MRSGGGFSHFNLRDHREQLVESNWQLADSMTGCMKDCIGDCRCYTNNTGLSEAFCAELIDNLDEFFMIRVVGLLDQIEADPDLLSPGWADFDGSASADLGTIASNAEIAVAMLTRNTAWS